MKIERFKITAEDGRGLVDVSGKSLTALAVLQGANGRYVVYVNCPVKIEIIQKRKKGAKSGE